MTIKRKSPAVPLTGLSTEDLVKRLRSFNRIIAQSSERFKVADAEVETLKITGVLYKRNLKVK